MVGQFFFFPLPHGVHRKQGHYPGGLKKEREKKRKRERERGGCLHVSYIKAWKRKKKKRPRSNRENRRGGKKGDSVRQREIRWNGLPTTTNTHTYITTHALHFVYVCINIFILNETDLSLDRDDIFFSPATWIKAKKRKKKNIWKWKKSGIT